MSVMGRKMTKSVSEKWSELFSIDPVCPPAGVYQFWPWSSSAILYVLRERAAHFSDSTHDQRPKKKHATFLLQEGTVVGQSSKKG